MSIEVLRARKKELLARKKFELELQEQGKGDNFALFMVNEELLDVNAQIRALVPEGRRITFGQRGRVSHDNFDGRLGSGERQQFIDWTRQDAEENADAARANMYCLLRSGVRCISDRQREVLLMWNEGLNMTEVAQKLGVSAPSVSRTIKAAKKTITRVFETQAELDRLRNENRLDLSNPEVAKFLLSALTPHQAVCFYLYFAEWLTLRQIGELLGVGHSTICRTTQRAITRINDVLGSTVNVLDNVEGLDEIVFAIYRGLCDQEDVLPSAVAAQVHLQSKPTEEYVLRRSETHRGPCGPFTPKPGFQVTGRCGIRHGSLNAVQHGQLFRALQGRYSNIQRHPNKDKWDHPILIWLMKIFRVMTNQNESKK